MNDTLKRIAPEEWDSYQDIHDRAMVDLVRDPRYVVYAADALIAKLVAAMEERDDGLKHLQSRWDWTEYWFDNLYPSDWDRCQTKYMATKRDARVARDRDTCRLHTDGSTEDCAPGHDCAECERGEER